MTSQPDGIVSDADLMAYLDRSLDAARTAQIEAALALDPDLRSRLAEWQHQNALMASLYQPAASEPLPSRLDVRRMEADRQDRKHMWQRLAAAAVLCVAIGAGGGWYVAQRDIGLSGPGTTQQAFAGLMDNALAAHRLYAADPTRPVAVSGNDGDALAIWLSKRLDRKLTIPNLDNVGWHLVGGTLLPAGDKPGAQIMYEDGEGRRLTLFFTPVLRQKDNAPPRFATSADLNVMNWTDAGLSCTIVAPIARQDIKQIAAEVYDQLI
jgi:anti-sigma factor RsiW